ncbi:general secretion pathway protein [Pusillimonas sp. ANT_WB101]|nr:general secretion pathway protein [Pusillimonas sp. ANT_WB101]
MNAFLRGYGHQLSIMTRLSRLFDRWRFRQMRVDYYDYLCALLHGGQGRRTLKEVFSQDAARFGQRSVRGRLSREWLSVYQASGGDLYITWRGSFPMIELSILRCAQAFGHAALTSTLGKLSETLRLAESVRGILAGCLSAAAMALGLLFIMLLAIPFYTLPQLLHAFAVLPSDHYGPLTLRLIGLARQVESWWLIAAVLLAAAAFVLLWSLPNAVGPVRRWLDRHAIWRIYRYAQTLRLLDFTAILLDTGGSGAIQLRTALRSQQAGASPWMSECIAFMLARIDAGATGAASFETPMLDSDHFWFLCDMVAARGLATGLQLCAARLRNHVLGTVSRQAQAWRWALLLSVVASMAVIGFFHYAVIDELRQSLIFFYAGQ